MRVTTRTLAANDAPQYRDPRASLVEAFFRRMNASGVSYAVMNNYEDLPDFIPSDIDITVPDEFFEGLDQFIINFADDAAAPVVQKFWHGNFKCAYILGSPSMGFLQLDFFVSFSTKGAPALLSHEELVASSGFCNGFRVPAPQVELPFVVMRRLFKNDWSERHCARVAELYGRIAGGTWLPQRYGWLKPTIQLAASGQVEAVAERREADWRKLRLTARQHCGVSGRAANTAAQSRRILHRLAYETGMIIALGAERLALDARSQISVETLFHRNVTLDEASLRALGPARRLSLPLKLALLKRRKGLVLLVGGPSDKLVGYLARTLSVMGMLDLTLQDPEQTVQDVIADITYAQAKKTRLAMAAGGTQTSGG